MPLDRIRFPFEFLVNILQENLVRRVAQMCYLQKGFLKIFAKLTRKNIFAWISFHNY